MVWRTPPLLVPQCQEMFQFYLSITRSSVTSDGYSECGIDRKLQAGDTDRQNCWEHCRLSYYNVCCVFLPFLLVAHTTKGTRTCNSWNYMFVLRLGWRQGCGCVTLSGLLSRRNGRTQRKVLFNAVNPTNMDLSCLILGQDIATYLLWLSSFPLEKEFPF
jgi:hypothetical protein